jgi:hypothetical protein
MANSFSGIKKVSQIKPFRQKVENYIIQMLVYNKAGRRVRPAVGGKLFHASKKGPCSSWEN